MNIRAITLAGALLATSVPPFQFGSSCSTGLAWWRLAWRRLGSGRPRNWYCRWRDHWRHIRGSVQCLWLRSWLLWLRLRPSIPLRLRSSIRLRLRSSIRLRLRAHIPICLCADVPLLLRGSAVLRICLSLCRSENLRLCRPPLGVSTLVSTPPGVLSLVTR